MSRKIPANPFHPESTYPPGAPAVGKITTPVKFSILSSALYHLRSAFRTVNFRLRFPVLLPDLPQLFIAFLIHHAVIQRPVSALGADVEMVRHIR